MAESLRCYRCGESLADLTPPISRQDQCPACFNYVHVCRMCVNFDANVPRQCNEDGAEDVTEKEKVNFCDWYKPSDSAFKPEAGRTEAAARNELGSLFGDGPIEAPPDNRNNNNNDSAFSAADDLFK